MIGDNSAVQTTTAAPRLLLAVALTLIAIVGPISADAAEPVRVGVIVDGPWGENELMRRLTIDEVAQLTEGEFEVRFLDQDYLIGDWTYATSKKNLERLLADETVDLVITWGVLSSHAVCCYGALPKPVIAPVVLDAEMQGIPNVDGASGVENLSYVALPNTLAEELNLFREVLPFHRVAVLGYEELFAALPRLMDRLAFEATARTGFDVQFVPTGRVADEILAAIPESVDAVYMWPQFQLTPEEKAKLIDGLKNRRLPTFSAMGNDLHQGLLATAVPEEFLPRLARRVALNLQRILLGEPAGTLPVEFRAASRLTINMKTARETGVSPAWDALVEAELLHPEPEGLPRRTLESVVREAVELNLDLRAQQRAVAAGAQERAIARANWLPQLSVDATGARIDADRAAASLGSQAEQTWSWGATLNQLLYSEDARANVETQRYLQEAREHEFETLRLDIAAEAAETLLNYLRTRSLVDVQRNNLRVTRSNLELARTRLEVGSAGAAEVYRWESQIAIDRRDLIKAQSDAAVARIAVNRLLHRNLDELFVVEEGAFIEYGALGNRQLVMLINTPERFALLQEFATAEGLEQSPELLQLRASIAAQRRGVTRARRAFWLPTTALQGTFDRIVSRSGAGADASGLNLGLPVEPADDSNWSLGLNASLPLYTGGARQAERLQAEEILKQLELTLSSAMEKVEQRIRSQLFSARAAFAAVRLTREASEAAAKNFELVADAYARGAVSVIDLLDAQTAALNADLQSANAEYDFLIELIRVQRAKGAIDVLGTADERRIWVQRLEEFFAAHDVELLAGGLEGSGGTEAGDER